MSTHSLREVHDHAALYAVGALPDEEARDFEAHLTGCEACREELQRFTSVSAELAIAAAVAPRPSLRERVLQRVSGIATKEGRLALDGGALQFVQSADIPWEQGAIQGVQFKLLLSGSRSRLQYENRSTRSGHSLPFSSPRRRGRTVCDRRRPTGFRRLDAGR